MAQYPPEFKARIVELYRDGERTYVDIAREFGLSPTSVANWVKAARADEGRDSAMTFAEREEVVSLRRRLRQKEEELEILGKALAFFARKTDQ